MHAGCAGEGRSCSYQAAAACDQQGNRHSYGSHCYLLHLALNSGSKGFKPCQIVQGVQDEGLHDAVLRISCQRHSQDFKASSQGQPRAGPKGGANVLAASADVQAQARET